MNVAAVSAGFRVMIEQVSPVLDSIQQGMVDTMAGLEENRERLRVFEEGVARGREETRKELDECKEENEKMRRKMQEMRKKLDEHKEENGRMAKEREETERAMAALRERVEAVEQRGAMESEKAAKEAAEKVAKPMEEKMAAMEKHIGTQRQALQAMVSDSYSQRRGIMERCKSHP